MDRVSSHPVLGCAEAKAWEAALLPDEAAEWQAMQRAGTTVATALLADFREIGGLPDAPRLLVLAGKGHNGGDALLAARSLLADRPQGRAVVVLCPGATALRPLAGRALDWLRRDAPGRVELVSGAEALPPGMRDTACRDGIYGCTFRAPMDESAG